jgi:hypothetical protein
MKRVAILYIHGLDNSDASYSDWMDDQIVSRVAPDIQVFSRAVLWADIFAAAASHLDIAERHYDLKWDALRSFVLSTVAQAVGYEGAPGDAGYDGVHERIREALTDLQAVAGPGAKLVIVAHSMGCSVISDFIYDAQAAGGFSELAALVTMGNPMALYAARYKDMGKPIKVGSLGGTWVNVFAPADVIAWPLRGLNYHYNREVTSDEKITVSGLLSFTPAAHIGYWTSLAVARRIAKVVTTVWNEA